MKDELKSRILELRERRGLTQRELAGRVGVTESTIANWERGRSLIDAIENLIKLCNELDCDLEDLIEREDLTGGDLKEVDLSDEDFRGKNLSKAKFYRATLNGANFQGVKMVEAQLVNASLQSSNLERANLEGANLERANLSKANLKHANLKNANLRSSILDHADLRGAILEGADLLNASLDSTFLKSADLREARNLPRESYDTKNEQIPFTIGGIPDQDLERLAKRDSMMADCLGTRLDLKFSPYIKIERIDGSSGNGSEVDRNTSKDTTYKDIVKAFKLGNIDLAWLGGFTLIQVLNEVKDAIAIAQRPIDQEFRTVFIANKKVESDILGKNNNLFGDSEELELLNQLCKGSKKRRLALGAKSSTSGDLIPIHYFAKAGINKTCFSEVRHSGSHDATIRLVTSGIYDIGALSQHVWDNRIERGEFVPNKVAEIWRSPPYRNYAWVTNSNVLDQEGGLNFIEDVRRALLGLKEHEQGRKTLELFGTKSFVATDNIDYAGLREIERTRIKDVNFFYHS